MRKLFLLAALPFICIAYAPAQTTSDSLTAVILHLDSNFWNAYNHCDTTAFKNYFTSDMEFYHDKGGITLGATSFIQSLGRNLCSNANYHLRREAVPGTIKVYPMHKGDELYGAIITGEHRFYITQNSKPEFLDGEASFTHLWLLTGGIWKMARLLSYNHHAVPYVSTKHEIQLDNITLGKLTGTYKSSQSGQLQLKRQENTLVLFDDKNSYILYPQSATSFFTKDRNLVFDFVLDTTGKPVKMVVKENGAVADELMFVP
jgi:hypothetical protein